jgi:hypothetical protein
VKWLPHALIVLSDKATQKGSLESFKALFKEESQFFFKFPGNFSDFGSKVRSYMF